MLLKPRFNSGLDIYLLLIYYIKYLNPYLYYKVIRISRKLTKNIKQKTEHFSYLFLALERQL